MTTTGRKAEHVFVGKRCERWLWKRTWPMSTMGGACKDLALEVGQQPNAEEINNALKDSRV